MTGVNPAPMVFWRGQEAGYKTMAVQIHDHARDHHPVGRVEADGTLFASLSGSEPVGRFDADGLVHDNVIGYHPVGRVSPDGVVHDRPYGYHPVGRVDLGGIVHDQPHGSHPVGHIPSADKSALQASERAGAAYLLLLRGKPLRA